MGGCDVVFGTEFRADAPAGVDDSDPSVRVTGRLAREFFSDSANGAVLTQVPHAANELAPEVWLDGQRGTIDWDFAQGSYAFDVARAGQRYRIVLEREPLQEIQSRFPDLAILQSRHERLGATPVTESPTIAGTLSNSVDDRYTYLMATGASWFQWGLDPDPAGNYSVVWPGRQLTSAAAGDRFLFAQYEASPNYQVIVRQAEVSVELANGANVIPASFVPTTPLQRCADLNAPQSALEDALAAAYPEFAPSVIGWTLVATPDASAGVDVQFTLADQVALDRDAITVEYHDPFGNFDHVALARAIRRRDLQNGALVIPGAYVYSFEVAKIDPSACPTYAAVPFASTPLAVPTSPRIGNAFLTRDGVRISMNGASELELVWNGGDANYFTIVLFDVTNRSTFDTAALVVVSTEPSALIETATLVPGNQYVALILARRGFQNATTGDFTRLAFPHGMTAATSAVFTILP